MVSTNDIVVESAPVVNIPQEPIEGAAAVEDDFEKAQKKYQLGKKNLLLNKYDDAVNNIGDACKVYSTKFGEFAPECAEVYFFYGKALLELARVENTVLGNALSGVPEDTGPIDDSRYGNPDDVAAEEKEDIADKVIDAMCEDNGAAAAASTDAATAVPEAVPITTETEVTTPPVTEAVVVEPTPVATDASGAASAEETATTTTTTTEAAAATNGEEGEEEGEDDEEDEGVEGEDEEDLTKNDETKGVNGDDAEDISNLQSAWEMFELAKLVFGKHFENDLPYRTKRIAECLIKLGEISIEQELYEQALIDIKESIRMQEETQTSERDERMLAESYYQFGLAYQFSEQFPLAGEQYQKSINILQLRTDKLKGLIEQTSDDFEKQQFKDEIAELETILPEMVSKLEEIKEQGEQSVKLIQEAKECFLNKVNEEEKLATATTNGTEVKDITSLVKSKRKIENVESGEETSIKKTKVDTEAEAETPIETDIAPAATEPIAENGTTA